MANRVTESEVEAIIEVDSNIDVDVFITAANLLITDKLGDEGLSDELLKEIERWLSAHFVAMRQRQTTDEKYGDAQQKFGGKFEMGLDFTQYGQQAKILDTSNKLDEVGKRSMNIQVFDVN